MQIWSRELFLREQINSESHSLENILQEVVKEVGNFGQEHQTSIPVIAGGGIYTEEDIRIIRSLVGMPGRAIGNSFLDKVKEGLKRPKNCAFNCIKSCDHTRSPYCIMLALYNAFRGKMDSGYAFCGANAWRAEKIETVKELITQLSDEFEAFKRKIGNM